MVKCPMCQRTLDNPRTLACLHTFCLGCLDHQKATTPVPLHCRQCNDTITVPTVGGFASLECNSFIDSLLKSLQGAPSDLNAVIRCDACKRMKLRCTASIVTRTSAQLAQRLIRNESATANHKQISLDDALAGTTTVKRIPRCQKHLGFEIDTYCKTCKESVCAKCCMRNTPNMTSFLWIR